MPEAMVRWLGFCMASAACFILAILCLFSGVLVLIPAGIAAAYGGVRCGVRAYQEDPAHHV